MGWDFATNIPSGPAISAGTNIATSGTVVFGNSNGVTFGLNTNNVLTASVAVGSAALQAISAGTAQITSGTVVFANSNGLTFGVSGQSVTGSYTQSTAPGAFAAGSQTATSGTIVFANSNGVSFGLSGSSQITASVGTSIGGLGANGVIPQFTGGGSQITTTPFSVGTDGRLVLGANYLQISATAAPGPAPTGNILLYVSTEQGGFERLHLVDESGLDFHVTEDILFIVRNTSGVSLPPGTAVYYTGSTGNTPNVGPANASDKTTMPALGVTVETIANNGFGRIMSLGRVANVNTAGFTEGDTLYVSATLPGGLTNVRPASPNLQQRVGIVVKSNATSGIIDVRIFSAKGDEFGTAENIYQIGDGFAGAKTVAFFNTSGRGDLAWNPSGNRTINLPDANGTVALLSNIGLTAISAGTAAITSGQVVFANSNNVSFGVSGQSVTATALQSTQPAIQAISAGTTLATTGSVVFANSNNVTFGLAIGTGASTGSASLTATVASSIGGLGANGVIPQFTNNGSAITTAPISAGTNGRLVVGVGTVGFSSGVSEGAFVWSPSTNRTISLPDETGIVTLNMKVVKLSLSTTSKTSTIAIPNSVTVLRTILDVTVAYDDPTTTWAIQRTGDATKVLQTTSDNNPTEVNVYEVPLTLDWGSTGAGTVTATLGGAPTVGAATLYIFYAVPVAID